MKTLDIIRRKAAKEAEKPKSRKPEKHFLFIPIIRSMEVVAVLFIVTIFILKIVNYANLESLKPANIYRGTIASLKHEYRQVKGLAVFNSCPKPLRKITIPDGYVCRAATELSTWQKIYDTYPQRGDGKEIVYQFLDNGDIAKADDFLVNKVSIDRFKTYDIGDDPQWTEDPFDSKYWRFNYYGLRPMIDLLYAGRITKEPRYNQKLIETTNSFIDEGMRRPEVWADYHAVAFRTMILTNTWWKLREQHALTVAESTKILKALKAHGDFLADTNHYEPGHNHGTNEAVALFLLSVSLPDIPSAREWQETAKERITSSLDSLIDDDGVLIENSPYYHFYTLQKYWALYKYTTAQHMAVSSDFEMKLNKMIDYATYILQPDGHIPLLGASLDAQIKKHGEYAEIAKDHPHFLYALTHGLKGKRPPSVSKFYPSAGQTIMRSGWDVGNKYDAQTQLTFDVGAYRTNHSDFDALSFSLYGDGQSLLPDSGLHSYSPGPYREYFHGTAAHNTVMVDGKNQVKGAAMPGEFVEKDGYTYQTAVEKLNDGVTHKRTIMMLNKKHIIIVDKLDSATEHNYEQLFHLFPGAKLKQDGLTIAGLKSGGNQAVSIRQLRPNGVSVKSTINQTNPVNGLCSKEYGKTIPCYAISYSQKMKSATYYTLITIGEDDPGYSADITDDMQKIRVTSPHKSVMISIRESWPKSTNASASAPTPPATIANPVPDYSQPANWISSLPNTLNTTPKDSDSVLRVNLPPRSKEFTVENNKVSLDLSTQNPQLRFKVENRKDLRVFRLSLSNNNWATIVSDDLKNAYREDYDGEWLTITLGKGAARNRDGHWTTTGAGNFNWSKIDGARLVLENKSNDSVAVELGNLTTVPAQKEGAVILVFDDGYESLLPAAEYLHRAGLKANIGVISKVLGQPTKGYLNISQLKKLQNTYGWGMANHSNWHEDALQTYHKPNKLSDFEADILAGAKYMQSNGLNSAPNWYIYPHGATNSSIKAIVGKYYKFARSTINDTEVYPFGDPLVVKTMSVQNDASEEGAGGSNSEKTTTNQISRAIADAKQFKTTLFLTFHRIHSRPTDRPGYELADFKEVVDDLKKQNVPVKTLGEFDAANGVSSNEIKFGKNATSQIKLSVEVKRDLVGVVMNLLGIH